MDQKKVFLPFSTRMTSSRRAEAPGKTDPRSISVRYVFCHLAAPKNAAFLTLSVVLQPSLIGQANGSAYIETAKTKIACAVCVLILLASFDSCLDVHFQVWPAPIEKHGVQRNGPAECGGQVHPFLLLAETSTHARESTRIARECLPIIPRLQDAEDRSIAVAIHQALISSVRLELLPKSTIDIFITVIESDGLDGCVASGSIAASTALTDAGIELLGLVTSCAAVSRDTVHFELAANASFRSLS